MARLPTKTLPKVTEVCRGTQRPATLLLSVGVTRDLFDGWAALWQGFLPGITNVVTGSVLRNGRTVDNAIGGAASGVVVNVSKP